jgi:hypothetical protein
VKINKKMLDYLKKIVIRMSQCPLKNGRHCSGNQPFLALVGKKVKFNNKDCRGSAFSANHTTSFLINNDIKWQFNKGKLK